VNQDKAATFAEQWAKEVLGVYAGVDTVVIRFRTEQGTDRCEVLTFGAGLVRTGHGTYPRATGGKGTTQAVPR